MPTNNSISCNSISLYGGASLVSDPSSNDGGTIYAREAILIDTYSNLQLRNWWYINATDITLYGDVIGAGLSFAASDTFLLSGTVSTDGQGFGPSLGPGAGQSGVGEYHIMH